METALALEQRDGSMAIHLTLVCRFRCLVFGRSDELQMAE